MTQKISSGVLKAITYYRKQKNAHPSHTETTKFTTDATSAYMKTNKITDKSKVEVGAYASGQGRQANGVLI